MRIITIILGLLLSNFCGQQRNVVNINTYEIMIHINILILIRSLVSAIPLQAYIYNYININPPIFIFFRFDITPRGLSLRSVSSVDFG